MNVLETVLEAVKALHDAAAVTTQEALPYAIEIVKMQQQEYRDNPIDLHLKKEAA